MKELIKKGKSKKIFATVLTLGLAMNVLTPFASAEQLSDTEKEYVVVYKNKSGKDAVIKGSRKVKTQFKSINALAVKASPNAMKALEKNPNIASVEENITFSLVSNKNVVQVLNKVEAKSTGTTVPAEESQWDIQAMKVSNAWNEGLTGKGIKVAVVDSGVANHPDLLIKGGVSTVDYTTSYNDDNGHGTHVAGSIGAKRDGKGLVGVAPDADLYAVKVMDQDGSGYLIDILEGLDWSIVNKMDVVNMSLGTSADSTAFRDMVAKAQTSGIVLVGANGNDGVGTPVNYPAKYNEVIAVSAVDQYLKIGSFSSTGVETELSAPGVAIVSTYLDGSYARLDGTSMASPHVAGFVALLKQKNPTMTNAQLRAELQKHTTDLGDAGRDSIFGYGFLTYESVAPTATPAPVVDTTAPGEVSGEKVVNVTTSSATLSWVNPIDPDFAKTNLYLNGQLLGSVDSTSTGVTISGLNASTSYTVTLKTVDQTGNESVGRNVTATTAKVADTTAPGVVKNVKLTATTSTSASFSWTNPTDTDFAKTNIYQMVD
ncbi:S8 family serine peptidase [Sporosarcina sp. Marseille-Q4943]|uniref:S8 family serine peptidase n=1 Tax=Sporosarcina sp. Marseille-Q4943 TaxID=2942204 RepID=UPI00208DDB63|nr:S8 family serine peptidase [Sporosarcina sp. Marseille-Q4943]